MACIGKLFRKCNGFNPTSSSSSVQKSTDKSTVLGNSNALPERYTYRSEQIFHPQITETLSPETSPATNDSSSSNIIQKENENVIEENENNNQTTNTILPISGGQNENINTNHVDIAINNNTIENSGTKILENTDLNSNETVEIITETQQNESEKMEIIQKNEISNNENEQIDIQKKDSIPIIEEIIENFNTKIETNESLQNEIEFDSLTKEKFEPVKAIIETVEPIQIKTQEIQIDSIEIEKNKSLTTSIQSEVVLKPTIQNTTIKEQLTLTKSTKSYTNPITPTVIVKTQQSNKPTVAVVPMETQTVKISPLITKTTVPIKSSSNTFSKNTKPTVTPTTITIAPIKTQNGNIKSSHKQQAPIKPSTIENCPVPEKNCILNKIKQFETFATTAQQNETIHSKNLNQTKTTTTNTSYQRTGLINNDFKINYKIESASRGKERSLEITNEMRKQELFLAKQKASKRQEKLDQRNYKHRTDDAENKHYIDKIFEGPYTNHVLSNQIKSSSPKRDKTKYDNHEQEYSYQNYPHQYNSMYTTQHQIDDSSSKKRNKQYLQQQRMQQKQTPPIIATTHIIGNKDYEEARRNRKLTPQYSIALANTPVYLDELKRKQKKYMQHQKLLQKNQLLLNGYNNYSKPPDRKEHRIDSIYSVTDSDSDNEEVTKKIPIKSAKTYEDLRKIDSKTKQKKKKHDELHKSNDKSNRYHETKNVAFKEEEMYMKAKTKHFRYSVKYDKSIFNRISDDESDDDDDSDDIDDDYHDDIVHVQTTAANHKSKQKNHINQSIKNATNDYGTIKYEENDNRKRTKRNNTKIEKNENEIFHKHGEKKGDKRMLKHKHSGKNNSNADSGVQFDKLSVDSNRRPGGGSNVSIASKTTQSEAKTSILNPEETDHSLRKGLIFRRKFDQGDAVEVQVYEKDKEARSLIGKAIEKNDFLNNYMDKERKQRVIDAMEPEYYEKDEFIIRENEEGSEIYVSEMGEFDVIKNNKVIATLGSGIVFGELAILYNAKRFASIKAKTKAKVWKIDRKKFRTIMLISGSEERKENLKFLKSAPFLRDLSDDVLLKICELLKRKFYPSETRIIRQGDKGDLFFIIRGGEVIIKKLDDSGLEKTVGRRKRGQYFGEQALLNTDKRTASVYAGSERGAECLILDRETFINYLGTISELKEKPRDKDIQPDIKIPPSQYDFIQLKDLKKVTCLGAGAFGVVDLVTYKDKHSFALKVVKKIDVIKQGQIDHIYNEKLVMSICRNCKFIVELYNTFRDTRHVYFLMEACLGGDVWTIMYQRKFFEEKTARFISGCVVEAFDYLHTRNIIYRDLKPENLMVTPDGYCKLVDFGFAKRLLTSSKTNTFAGTPEYVAPEIILDRGHDRAVDYWALGILIYELLAGRTPFRGTNQMRIYQQILTGIDGAKMSAKITKTAQSLIKNLCKQTPAERLGYQRRGILDIKKHSWYDGFDWNKLRNQQMSSPIKRPIKSITDTTYFPTKFENNGDVPPEEMSGWDDEF